MLKVSPWHGMESTKVSLVVAGSSGSSRYARKIWRLGIEECGGKKPKAAKKTAGR